MQPWRRQRALDAASVGLPLLLLYLATLQRDVGIIDSGELAGVAARLGVAHPTGYPLYSLLGRVAAWMAPGGHLFACLSGLSALSVALAAFLLVGWVRELAPLDTLGTGRVGRPESGRRFDWIPRVGGLALGASAVAWSQAVTNEVYGLHLLVVVIVLRLATSLLVAVRREGTGINLAGPGREPPDRQWAGGRGSGPLRRFLLLAYVVGLSAGHHLSIVFLGPAVLFAVVVWLGSVPPRVRLSWIGLGTGFGLLGASCLAYLPIRSREQPLFDWGDPESLPRFWRHVTGAQYQVWQFQSSDRFAENAIGYVTQIPERIGWALLPLSLWGAVVLWKRDRRRFVFLALVALVAFIWASGYEIFDLEPYYLPVDVTLVVWATLGAMDIASRAWTRTKQAQWTRAARWGLGVLAAAWAVQVALRYPEVDRSNDHVVRYHVDSLLATVPEDAVLLSSFWDAVVSPLLYEQAVEGKRTDVSVVDTELLRRSWYYPQLSRWDPELLTPVRPLVDEFLDAVAPFESGGTFDSARLERAFRGIIEGLAQEHRPARPTAFTTEINPFFTRNSAPIPEGLVFVLRDDPASSPEIPPPQVDGLLAAGFRPSDRIHGVVVSVWARMFRARVRYLRQFGRDAEAGVWERELDKLRPYVTEDAPF
ncbi:MAG: DUF2723 domain-containing protein [Candidatus Eisenbacteria bacterium]|uniref:DUF2723 domain-containing protein n=1 Tax=Eiseniibacteriota bacterium TaxID=2212470 RepID=A0A956SBR5_UNCEI|nr:DUF2723 domain-containing protein [Candidatus Eisenbacteria bacterium]